MWTRLRSNDVRVVGHSLGMLIQLTGALMAVPLVVALFCHETNSAYEFLIGIGSCLCIGGALRMLRTRASKLNRRQAMLVVGFSWIVIALVAAIPMWVSGQYGTFLDALFDAVSMITTTGVSIASDSNHLASSQVIWRILLVFVGGQGVIVAALSIGLFGRSGGGATSLYNAEGRSDHVLPNIIQTTRFVWIVSGSTVVLGTIIGTVICRLEGMSMSRAAFSAFILTVSAFDNGGYAQFSSSLIYYHSAAIEVFCAVLMLAGCISFVLYAGLLSGKVRMFFRNMELRVLAVWLAAMTLITCVVLGATSSYTTLPELLRRGMFMVVSSGTGGGYQTVYAGQFGVSYMGSALFLLLVLMVVGGSTGSTSGGIKAMRVGILVKWFVASVRGYLMPSSAEKPVRYYLYREEELTPQVATHAMTISVLYIVITALGALVGVAYGYDAMPAMLESAACTSNGGIVIGIVTQNLEIGLKLLYMLQMWGGRLEFLALFSVLAGIGLSAFNGIKNAHKRLTSL